MIDQLKTIGIERGKRFDPNAETQDLLLEAIQEAKAWLEALYVTLPPYYANKHWFFPISEEMARSVGSRWRTVDSYPIDDRGLAYTIAFFSGMHVGEAQYYLMAIQDSKGKTLEGGGSYRLTVPPNVPVTQYWSVTVYNRETHTFIREAQRLGRSSQTPELRWNKDGSADIYFGPAASPGKESNWIPTDRNGAFEVLARFYGPQKALFDKTWAMPDIERTK
jgi:hypothetical protein